jgi:hypothetical protein
LRSQVHFAEAAAGAISRRVVSPAAAFSVPGRVEAMTTILGSICAVALGAAILTAAPAPAVASGGYEKLLHKAVYAWELNDEGAVPYYDDENYCWQQVWTAHGWRWVDVCHGYAF